MASSYDSLMSRRFRRCISLLTSGIGSCYATVQPRLQICQKNRHPQSNLNLLCVCFFNLFRTAKHIFGNIIKEEKLYDSCNHLDMLPGMRKIGTYAALAVFCEPPPPKPCPNASKCHIRTYLFLELAFGLSFSDRSSPK